MAGLSSLSKNINIKGQPHSLAYINKAEAALLKARGGSGKPMKGTRGVPAYIDMGEGMGGYGSGAADDATAGEGDPGAGMSGAETDAAGTYGGGAADAADKGALQGFYAMSPETISLMGAPEALDHDDYSMIKEEKTSKFLPKPDASALGQDYVLQAAITNPEYKVMYDNAIREAAKSMTSNEIHGVMGQDGYRDGRGYISHLERGGFDRTWGLGIRGENEVRAPVGMTKDQYSNYTDLYMAFDETQAGNLRMALDAVPKDSPETVGSIFGKAGVDPSLYGFDPEMNPYYVAKHVDSEAITNIVTQGFPMLAGILTGNVSPMMIPNLVQPNILGDIVTEINNQVVGTPLENPVKAAQDLGVELEETYEEIGPKNFLDGIKNLFGIPSEEDIQANLYKTSEPTVESLMTEEENANFDLNYNMTRDVDGNPIAFINRDVTTSEEEYQRMMDEVYEQNRELPPPGYTQTPEQTEELMRMIGAN